MKIRTLIAAVGVVLAVGACDPAPGVGTPLDPPAPTPPPATSRPSPAFVPAAPAAPTRAAVNLPASIDATGRTDVTHQLTAFLDGLPDGSLVQFPRNGRFLVEGTVYVSGARGLHLRFNGSTLFANTDGTGVTPPTELKHRWPRHRAHLFVGDSTDVTITGLNIVGPNRNGGLEENAYVEALEAQHAIELSGVTRAVVEGNDVSYMYGDGINITRGSLDVVVRGNSVHHTGRQGIAVTGAGNLVVSGNLLDQVRRSAFDLEPNAEWFIRTVRITENVVGEARLSFVAGLGRGSEFRDVEIARNRLTGMPMKIRIEAPEGRRRSDIRIIDNHADVGFGSTQAAIRLAGIDGATVTGNHQPLAARRRGLLVEANLTCGLVVSGNTFPGGTAELLTDGYRGC